jgi:5-methylcytosine-specific restriction endonuclease McrA
MTLIINENGRACRPGKDQRSHNGGARPNAYQRRANRYFLLVTFGDGQTCPCVYCGDTLEYSTIEVDRVIPGAKGGSYRRENIVPACFDCNRKRGDKSVWAFNPLAARRLKRRGYILTTR